MIILASLIIIGAFAVMVYHMVIDARLSEKRDNLEKLHASKELEFRSAQSERKRLFPKAAAIATVDELTPEQEGEILSQIDQIVVECDDLTEEISILKEKAMNS